MKTRVTRGACIACFVTKQIGFMTTVNLVLLYADYRMPIRALFVLSLAGLNLLDPVTRSLHRLFNDHISSQRNSHAEPPPPFSVSLTDSLSVTTNLDKWKTGVNYDIWVIAQWPVWGKSRHCFASLLKKVKPPGKDSCVSAAGFRKQSLLVVRGGAEQMSAER